MNIFEMVRRDREESSNEFDRVDELGLTGEKPSTRGFHQHLGRPGYPDDFDESYPVHSLLMDGPSREVPLEEIDDRLVVDLWLRETARG